MRTLSAGCSSAEVLNGASLGRSGPRRSTAVRPSAVVPRPHRPQDLGSVQSARRPGRGGIRHPAACRSRAPGESARSRPEVGSDTGDISGRSHAPRPAREHRRRIGPIDASPVPTYRAGGPGSRSRHWPGSWARTARADDDTHVRRRDAVEATARSTGDRGHRWHLTACARRATYHEPALGHRRWWSYAEAGAEPEVRVVERK